MPRINKTLTAPHAGRGLAALVLLLVSVHAEFLYTENSSACGIGRFRVCCFLWLMK